MSLIMKSQQMTDQNLTVKVEELVVPTKDVIQIVSSNGSVNGSRSSCCASTKRFFLYDSARKDIQAFYFNQFGRSTLFISFMFLSLAILQLANEQAGCPKTESGGYENCGNEVHGMQPSSMLSLMAIIGGLTVAAFMPYAGAVVDYSDHRLRFGKAMAAILVLANVVQIFLFPSTWFAMTIIQAVFASSSFMANSIVLWSYLSAPNDHELHGITASGRIWETAGMLFTFIIIGIVQFTSGWDSVNVARFGQAYASVVGGITLFFAYTRYEPVKAVKKLEAGKNLYIAGIVQLWRTIWDLGNTEPAVQRYLFCSIFIEASVGSFTNLAITYLTGQIGMSGTLVVAFIVLNLTTNPLGVFAHRTVARLFGHKKSFIGVVIWFIVVSALFIGIVAGPDQIYLTWLFAVLYGIAYGWYYPSSNGYYVSLVPAERVSELWGFNLFASAALSWVPPLIFTSINESTGNLRLGLVGLVVFFVIGLLIAFTIPQKEIASDVVGDMMKEEENGDV